MTFAARRCARIALLLALTAVCAGEAFPQVGYGQGYPQPGGWVNDFAGVLDSQNRQRLFNLCVELERKTTCEMTIVTMPSIGGQSIESYAQGLFNQWGVGKKGANNGVMILFAMRERKLRIQVGSGLGGPLPDALCKRIIDGKIVPFMKVGRYGDGAYAGAAEIASILSKHYGASVDIPAPLKITMARRISGWMLASSKRLLHILLLPFLLIIVVIRLLLGRLFGIGTGDGGGWTSGWGGGGGFGGGFSSGGGASGSW